MDQRIIDILQAIRAAAEKVALLQPDIVNVQQATQRLIAAVKDVLPEKADGTAFTDEELHAMAEAATAPFDNVLNRDGGLDSE